MELRDLLDLLDGVPVLGTRGDPGVPVTGITLDSRAVEPGDLYCCVPGSSSDGHDFAPAAVSAGAAALLVERFLDVEIPQVKVARVRDAVGPLASAIFGDPSAQLTVVGVTGTNGKTTTTYLLEGIAEAAGLVPGVVGTVETRIGGRPLAGELTTPEAPQLQALFARMLAEGVGMVAMEVSSHALSMGRVDGTRFAAAVFTNLSHDHLDFHGSFDDYFEAKARLFEPGRARSAAVNVGDPYGAELARRVGGQGIETLTFAPPEASVAGPVSVTASSVRLDRGGTTLTLVAPDYGAPIEVRSPLVGAFNVSNVLAATAAALAAGVELPTVASGLELPVRVPGRFEPVDRGQQFLAVVDYAHTPDALAHVLRAARDLAAGHRVLVVFGCGGDRDRDKRPAMGAVAAELADAAYVTSDNPRSEAPGAIVDEILGGVPAGVEPVVELDRRAAIARAVRDARPGDVLVVAGKGHETGQVVGAEVLPFDDREVVGAELEAARCG